MFGSLSLESPFQVDDDRSTLLVDAGSRTPHVVACCSNGLIDLIVPLWYVNDPDVLSEPMVELYIFELLMSDDLSAGVALECIQAIGTFSRGVIDGSMYERIRDLRILCERDDPRILYCDAIRITGIEVVVPDLFAL